MDKLLRCTFNEGDEFLEGTMNCFDSKKASSFNILYFGELKFAFLVTSLFLHSSRTTSFNEVELWEASNVLGFSSAISWPLRITPICNLNFGGKIKWIKFQYFLDKPYHRILFLPDSAWKLL